MKPNQQNHIATLLRSIFADRPVQSVADWCCEHLRFDEPENRGPFSLAGREYIREPLDSFADATISDQVQVFGSQTGKTAAIMGGAAWTTTWEPSRIFWVMPTRDTARSFSRTRWMPMLRNSPAMAALIPTGGQKRHDFATLQQQVGGGIVDMVWSNSPAALASIPARVVILDEVDKFDEGGRSEADAVNLAEQRTKDFATPKRIKTSTPTLTDGLIWQEFLKTDMRRRFVPCPHCGKFVVFGWAREFTIMPITGAEAFIRWDAEARREKEWDLDRVERSARAECPHCRGHITDAHKTLCDRGGEWRPTSTKSARGYRGWHLPSLYSCKSECNFGRLAVKFLQAKRSLLGLQGFVNGDLAEPWENQDSRSERVEIIVRGAEADKPVGDQTVRLLTADVQAVSPYFWAVARDWTAKGHSRLAWQGPLDTWEAIREKQLALGVADNHVLIDSGDGAQVVYDNCLRFGKLLSAAHTLPIWCGWMPGKGREREAKWTDPKTKLPRPFLFGSAALPHQRFRLPLLEFNGDALLDILSKLRRGPDKSGGIRWELIECADETYFRHLDAKVKKAVTAGRTGRTEQLWCLRSRRWPDHLLDCELMQLALAMFHKLFPWALPESKP